MPTNKIKVSDQFITEDLYKVALIICLTNKKPDKYIVNEVGLKLKKVAYVWEDKSKLPLSVLRRGEKAEIEINEFKKIHRKLISEVFSIIKPKKTGEKTNE